MCQQSPLSSCVASRVAHPRIYRNEEEQQQQQQEDVTNIESESWWNGAILLDCALLGKRLPVYNQSCLAHRATLFIIKFG